MEVFGKIEKVSQPRVLQGNQGDLKVVDVTVNCGCDSFLMGAFDKLADAFTSGTIKQGCLCHIKATATVRESKEKSFQSMRMDSCSMMIDPNKVF